MAKKTKKEKKADLEKDKARWEKQRVPMKDIPTYDARREPVDATDDRVLRTLRSIPTPIPKNEEGLKSFPTYDASQESADSRSESNILKTLRSIPKPDLKNPGKGQAPKQ